MDQVGPIVIAVLGSSAIAALLGYLTARRRDSGQVNTTPADQLWSQNQSLIAALLTDNKDLRDQLSAVRDEYAELRTEYAGVKIQMRELEAQHRKCETAIAEVRSQQKGATT